MSIIDRLPYTWAVANNMVDSTDQAVVEQLARELLVFDLGFKLHATGWPRMPSVYRIESMDRFTIVRINSIDEVCKQFLWWVEENPRFEKYRGPETITSP
jgi:hypothetical protein